MDKFVLTCIDENINIISQKIFDTIELAEEEMKFGYEELKRILNTYKYEIVSEDYHPHIEAEIVYDSDPCFLKWMIRCVRIDEKE